MCSFGKGFLLFQDLSYVEGVFYVVKDVIFCIPQIYNERLYPPFSGDLSPKLLQVWILNFFPVMGEQDYKELKPADYIKFLEGIGHWCGKGMGM